MKQAVHQRLCYNVARIGYNRAAKLMDRMEKSGFISGPRGSKARDVFLTESDLDRLTDRIE